MVFSVQKVLFIRVLLRVKIIEVYEDEARTHYYLLNRKINHEKVGTILLKVGFGVIPSLRSGHDVRIQCIDVTKHWRQSFGMRKFRFLFV